LRYFLAVVEDLNYGRAAKKLLIAGPSLSQQIKNLERDLGVRLFDCDRRAVAMTPAGSALLPYVRDLVERAEDLRRLAAGSGRWSRYGWATSTGCRQACWVGPRRWRGCSWIRGWPRRTRRHCGWPKVAWTWRCAGCRPTTWSVSVERRSPRCGPPLCRVGGAHDGRDPGARHGHPRRRRHRDLVVVECFRRRVRPRWRGSRAAHLR
jgi:hypothetical protein